MRELTGVPATAVKVIALGMAVFHLYTAGFGSFVALIQRSIHLMFAMTLVFLLFPAGKRSRKDGVSLLDVLLGLAAAWAFSYVFLHYDAINERIPGISEITAVELIAGGTAILLTLEGARRALGTAMAVIPALFLSYALFGDLLSGSFSHPPITVAECIEYMYLGYDGLFGIPSGISATYLVLFIIFGCIMEKTGAGQVIMDLACALAGRSRGGPAKIAVISSALFGSISGAAVANVYSTGVFTIPLMKRLGYRAEFAGAVEAVSSTGGQIMPPVMGAAAFLMAEWLAIPYSSICVAALLPALLYYLAVIAMVHLEAARTGMTGLEEHEIPKVKDIVKRLYLLLPLAVLTVMLFVGYSVSRSVLFSIILALGLSMLSPATRLSLRQILDTLALGCQRSCMLAMATASAGLIIGVVTETGVGLTLTSNIVVYFKDTLPLALVFIMVASLIMGMGVPTVVAYLLVATLTAPILTKLGVSPLQAHMFVFYFAVISMITPPVAMASWAGAEIAGADFNRTGLQAVKLGIVAFIIPFMFVYDDALLLQGTFFHTLSVVVFAIIGIFVLAFGLEGWMMGPISPVFRVVLVVAGILLIDPSWQTDLLGLITLLGVSMYQKFGRRMMCEKPQD